MNLDPYADPPLFIGVDIGYARDTLAVSAVFRHPHERGYCLWGHRIWKPDPKSGLQVQINKTAVPMLLHLLEHQRVAAVLYDPYQFKSEAQRLEEGGYGRVLREVNQSSESVIFTNTLHDHIYNHTFYTYPDPELRSHFSWAAGKQTERGWRLVKLKQAKPIDGVVSIAMALMGATDDLGHTKLPAYRDETHSPSLMAMP